MTDDISGGNFAIVRALHQAHDGAMGDNHSLRNAGRTGGEHDVSRFVHPACKIALGQGLRHANVSR